MRLPGGSVIPGWAVACLHEARTIGGFHLGGLRELTCRDGLRLLAFAIECVTGGGAFSEQFGDKAFDGRSPLERQSPNPAGVPPIHRRRPE
jgi:hypothetical protein